MAQAAHDHLPAPALEVDIERLFNVGRDIPSIHGFEETLSTMILLDALKMQESRQK